MRGGGGQRPFGTFPKINPYWCSDPSLRNSRHWSVLLLPLCLTRFLRRGCAISWRGAPSMAVNRAKATSADQTISWWSWAPLMNWGEGSAMGHQVTKKLSHTWTFFNPDVKENSCLIRLFPERKVLVKHHMWLMKTESVWSISWKRFMRLYAACLKVPPPPPNELTIEREGAQIGGWVWPSLEPSPSLATSFYQPLFCPSIVCLLDILLSIKLSILLDVCPRNIFMASLHFRRTFNPLIRILCINS